MEDFSASLKEHSGHKWDNGSNSITRKSLDEGDSNDARKSSDAVDDKKKDGCRSYSHHKNEPKANTGGKNDRKGIQNADGGDNIEKLMDEALAFVLSTKGDVKPHKNF